MSQYTLDLIFALGLLGIAANLTLFLYLNHLNRQTRRILERSTPEFPDLTPAFIDLQERISSEAETSRKEALSHARNTQTSVRTLAGLVGQLPKADELAGCISNEATSVVEAVAADIREDGKKTRERIAQAKTRLTWSRKREHADLDDDLWERQRQTELRSLIERLENDPLYIQSDSSLPAGTMVLTDTETGSELTVTDVTAEDLAKAAKKASKAKARRASSKANGRKK